MPYFTADHRIPRLKIMLDNLTVTAGETVVVACYYSGRPRPVVEWRKDDRPVPSVDLIDKWQLVFEEKNVRKSFRLTCMSEYVRFVGLDLVNLYVNVLNDYQGMYAHCRV